MLKKGMWVVANEDHSNSLTKGKAYQLVKDEHTGAGTKTFYMVKNNLGRDEDFFASRFEQTLSTGMYTTRNTDRQWYAWYAEGTFWSAGTDPEAAHLNYENREKEVGYFKNFAPENYSKVKQFTWAPEPAVKPAVGQAVEPGLWRCHWKNAPSTSERFAVLLEDGMWSFASETLVTLRKIWQDGKHPFDALVGIGRIGSWPEAQPAPAWKDGMYTTKGDIKLWYAWYAEGQFWSAQFDPEDAYNMYKRRVHEMETFSAFKPANYAKVAPHPWKPAGTHKIPSTPGEAPKTTSPNPRAPSVDRRKLLL